jgi:hypothetical protein
MTRNIGLQESGTTGTIVLLHAFRSAIGGCVGRYVHENNSALCWNAMSVNAILLLHCYLWTGKEIKRLPQYPSCNIQVHRQAQRVCDQDDQSRRAIRSQ